MRTPPGRGRRAASTTLWRSCSSSARDTRTHTTAGSPEAAAAVDHELDAFLHLWCLNRGILLTPFHNMALMSPAHSMADVDRHSEVFAEAVTELVAPA